MDTLADIRKTAERFGLKLSDAKHQHPSSCHCWGPRHPYGSLHAWWCPCNPASGVSYKPRGWRANVTIEREDEGEE